MVWPRGFSKYNALSKHIIGPDKKTGELLAVWSTVKVAPKRWCYISSPTPSMSLTVLQSTSRDGKQKDGLEPQIGHFSMLPLG